MQILAPISRIAETVLARVAGDEMQYRKVFMQIAEATLLVTLPGLLCIAIMPDSAVNLLYGPAWVDCAPIVGFFAFGSLMLPLGSIATWLLITQGRTAQMLRYGLIGNVLSVVSLLMGISWGAVGVALAFAVFSIPIHGLTIWAATRDGPVTLADFFRMLSPVLIAIAAAGFSVTCYGLLAAHYGFSSVMDFAGGLFIAYLVTALALACFSSGRRVLRDAARVREIFNRRKAPAES